MPVGVWAPVRDRLEEIQGITPEMAQHLNEAGIYTFADLGALRPQKLKEILGGQMPQPGGEVEIIKQARLARGMIKKVDDLEVIVGIGPVIARTLNNAGVFTFAELASLMAQDLREIVGAVVPTQTLLAPTNTVALSTSTAPAQASSTPTTVPPAATTTPQPSPTATAIAPTATPTTVSQPEPTATPQSAPTATPATAAQPEPTAIPQAPSGAADCPLAQPSRLAVGKQALVTTNLNLRQDAGMDKPIIQVWLPKTKVEIVGGPVCTPYQNGAYLWWNIKSPDGKTGWSAEASVSKNFYFLQPVP